MDQEDNKSEKWLSKINKLHRFLQGELPKEVSMKYKPKLSPTLAWDVIWFLQEITRIIPDNFERCSQCGDIFDSWTEGIHVSEDDYRKYGKTRRDIGKHFCGYCE